MDLREYEHETDNGRRILVVHAALELLMAEASAGMAIDGGSPTQVNNPVKQYADWIEEALKVKAESS